MASEPPTKPSEEEQQYSSSELLSSAKLVAEAAQYTFRNESDKVDKAKVADAAGDLLDATGKYAKLDEQKGIGQYVDKAADYLHQYQGTTTPSKPSTTTPSESDPPKHESQGDSPHSGDGDGDGDGYGQFAKLAGGFLKKH